jgi:epoxyqueuosine reductase
LHPASAADLLRLTSDQFRERFRHTPLARPGRAGLLRNAAIVLGNRGDATHLPLLEASLGDDEPLIRGAAAWAIGRLGSIDDAAELQSCLDAENNADVRRELELALAMLTTPNGPRADADPD